MFWCSNLTKEIEDSMKTKEQGNEGMLLKKTKRKKAIRVHERWMKATVIKIKNLPEHQVTKAWVD